jgi:hypothetical protein
MGTQGSVPAVAVQNGSGWRRLFIKAAGFGAGFALMLALVMGVGLWWSERPKPPKPWNSKAITAEYDYARVTGEKNHINFGYVFQNNTDEDFRIDSADELSYAIKLGSQKAISILPKDSFILEFPIVIPARQRVYIPVELNVSYTKSGNDELPLEERKKFRKEVERYFSGKYDNIVAFQFFDEQKRLKIDLPGGWRVNSAQ